jgi:outer membrane protein TolC
VAGLNTTVQIQYRPPLSNSAVRGAVLQAEAAYQQAAIASTDLSRVIQSNTALATEALLRSRSVLEHNDEAVRLSRIAVEVEKTKFQLGISTLFDALLSEDTLTNALLAQINGQVRFAGAIARLRFETGTLVEVKGDDPVVDTEALTTISLGALARR